MSIVMRGGINNAVPYFLCFTTESGTLTIKEEVTDQKDGDDEITVDTGFSGTVVLPQDVLDQMGFQYTGYGYTFVLADGSTVPLPLYWGKVKTANKTIDTWFIPGDYLLGMELLALAGTKLTFEFPDAAVTLEE